YGTFTIGTDGTWTYSADNSQSAVQQLGAGQTLTETFTVKSTDGTPASVTVTINGTNDAAVISSAGTTGSVTEDVAVDGTGHINTGGTLSVTDVDAGQAGFQANTVHGAYGTFTIGTDGTWTYLADNSQTAVQQLGAGQTLTETFTVKSTDGTPATVTVTINGTNDAAVISSAGTTGAVTEDTAVDGTGHINTGGTLSVTDVDAGQAGFQANTVHGAYGTFTIGTDGTWTYSADNSQSAVQQLGAGQTLTETFTVKSTDGTPGTVTVTINGTNDAAVISSAGTTGSVTEDVAVDIHGLIQTGGTLTVTDVDAGQSHFQAENLSGLYGTFRINSAGVWVYSAVNSQQAIQQLGEGQSLTETFQVKSADGTPAMVTVTIHGTNDAAVISSLGSPAPLTEDVNVNASGNLVTGGTLSVTDVDAGQSAFQAATTTGAHGTFAIASDGTWTYTAANNQSAIQALGSGQSLTETFTVKSVDGTSSTVSVTILGTNDAPVLSLDSNGSSGATTGNYLTRFAETGAGVSVVDSDVSIKDVDSANLTGATVHLT
ncbi:MAG: VCBS domain-containing protein, partial [Burkholderiales bacterium]|nr:VCBS domain-containing protein [Burkholderiales bacterium]